MQQHQYRLESNLHVTDDQKWVIFRANFEGVNQIYRVKIEKQ